MFSNQQTQDRQTKATRMLDAGHSPYPSSTTKRTISNEGFLTVYTNTASKNKEENVGEVHTVIGRVKLIRNMGKAGFIKIEDQTGLLQAFVSLNDLGEDTFSIFKSMLDIGDILQITGYPFFTKTEELTVHATDIKILTKSLLPLPEKFHGLEDKETRYRKRYLDMIMNNDVSNVFVKRAKIISSIRQYMDQLDFIEVETPMLNAIPGGANARPFVTFHNALDAERFLRIAPELYLKRMIVGGLEKVFEIGKNFRNEGVDATHNPEFTSIEFYEAHATYEDLMGQIEDMFRFLNSKVNTADLIPYGDHQINFDSWTKISFRNALIEIGGIPADILDDKEKIISFLKEKGITVKPGFSLGKLWEELFDEFVEAHLINPTFITEYPTEISPLARRHDSNPDITERFELFIAGREIANGFNELNDPVDQYNRFKAQVESKGSDDEAMHMDSDFVEALMHGMPPTAGAGIGIDRLVMLLTNQHSIRDVIPFPAMK
jgi:lysyl-tRNA synthetase class 2